MAGGVGVTIGGEALSDINSRVSSISIQRGRQDELDRTETGTCTVSLNYVDGSISDFVGEEGTVTLTSPHGGTATVFSGVVDDVSVVLEPSQVATRVDVTMADMLDKLAGIELAPGLFGEVPLPAGVLEGNIFYEQSLPQDRIWQALLEAGLSLSGTEVFTGNVQVKDTIYSPRTSLLTVIDDACDAEFPGVANRGVYQDGSFFFHGRLARFNPGDGQYHIATYAAGDGAACVGDSSRARIHRCQLGVSRQRIINAALATPEGISDSEIEAQIVTDSGSITTYGTRSWSAAELLTFYDELNDLEALDATRQFAQYYVDNYSSPQTRVEELTFASRDPAWANSAATWNVLLNADISDLIDLQVTNPGISVNSEFFIEGVRMEITPLHGGFPLVKKSLDLSPRAFWNTAF